MTDAFLTFLVLAIASVVLWRASLAPLDAIERSTEDAEAMQVSSMIPALLRITLDETIILDPAGGSKVFRGESIAHLLATMYAHVYPTGCEPSACPPAGGQSSCQPKAEADACEVAPAARDILRTAASLGTGRWILRIEISSEDGALCVRGLDETDAQGDAIATRSPCDHPPTRIISQEAFVPRHGSASSVLRLQLGAFKALGR